MTEKKTKEVKEVKKKVVAKVVDADKKVAETKKTTIAKVATNAPIVVEKKAK